MAPGDEKLFVWNHEGVERPECIGEYVGCDEGGIVYLNRDGVRRYAPDDCVTVSAMVEAYPDTDTDRREHNTMTDQRTYTEQAHAAADAVLADLDVPLDKLTPELLRTALALAWLAGMTAGGTLAVDAYREELKAG